jgi:enoyl-CoA hydratase/carnithine racemase
MISVALDPHGGALVARVTLDNPSKLNILSADAASQLAADMRALEHDPRIRAVVLAGAGPKAFAGGADLDTLGSLNPATARVFIGRIHDACAAMRECPVPVIARIHGWCLGAGLELAAACDLRIAADDAKFGMPEVRLGIPSVVEAALLPRLVGAGRARWLVMTGETIGAAEALAWGLVEKVVPAAQLDAAVDAALDAIIAGEPKAIRAQKRLCKTWEETTLAESVRVSIEEFSRAYDSDEPKRRVAAIRAARRKKK